jgi:hypothetical protein
MSPGTEPGNSADLRLRLTQSVMSKDTLSVLAQAQVGIALPLEELEQILVFASPLGCILSQLDLDDIKVKRASAEPQKRGSMCVGGA